MIYRQNGHQAIECIGYVLSPRNCPLLLWQFEALFKRVLKPCKIIGLRRSRIGRCQRLYTGAGGTLREVYIRLGHSSRRTAGAVLFWAGKAPGADAS